MVKPKLACLVTTLKGILLLPPKLLATCEFGNTGCYHIHFIPCCLNCERVVFWYNLCSICCVESIHIQSDNTMEVHLQVLLCKHSHGTLCNIDYTIILFHEYNKHNKI